jgi:hypothetical protein
MTILSTLLGQIHVLVAPMLRPGLGGRLWLAEVYIMLKGERADAILTVAMFPKTAG